MEFGLKLLTVRQTDKQTDKKTTTITYPPWRYKKLLKLQKNFWIRVFTIQRYASAVYAIAQYWRRRLGWPHWNFINIYCVRKL